MGIETIGDWWSRKVKPENPGEIHDEIFVTWERYTPEETHEMNVEVIGPRDATPEEIAEATGAVKELRREGANYADYGPDELHEKSMATGIEVMSNYVKGVAEEGRKLLSPANNERHPMSQRFHDILDECKVLHDKKQKDYGRDSDPFANVRGSVEWDMPAWVGAMIRAHDKIRRLQQYAQKGHLENEGVEDAFMDLINYTAIAYVLWEEEQMWVVPAFDSLEGVRRMSDPRWQTVREALHEAWAVDAQEALSALDALEEEMEGLKVIAKLYADQSEVERLREALRGLKGEEVEGDVLVGISYRALNQKIDAALGGEE